MRKRTVRNGKIFICLTLDAFIQRCNDAEIDIHRLEIRDRSIADVRYERTNGGNVRKTIPVGNITWSSSDPAVVTFADGVVTAVANGSATVYAEYNGEKVSCAITCDFNSNSGVEGNGGVSEDGGGSSTAAKTGVIANVQVDANVRSEPRIVNGANTNVVGTIALGTKVSITDEKVADGYTWYKIGENRWVASNYVKLD